jgi:hypothetical protein
MKFIFAFGLVLFWTCLIGQAHLSVDRTEVVIGDQVEVRLRMELRENQRWINQDRLWPDSLPGIEIVSGPEAITGENTLNSYRWTIACFDTGIVRIPSLAVILAGQQSIDTQWTIDIPIRVLPVEPDSSGLIPIKGIYQEPFRLGFYKKYIPHLLALLLLLTGIWWWWKKRKRKPEAAPIPVAAPSPAAWALEALANLEREKLWQRGEVKSHYSQLTDIFRGYLERRYQIHAMEQTTDEIVSQLQQVHLNQKTAQDISDLLSISDLVKFAKADPGMDIHAAAIDRIRVFVSETSADGMVE